MAAYHDEIRELITDTEKADELCEIVDDAIRDAEYELKSEHEDALDEAYEDGKSDGAARIEVKLEALVDIHSLIDRDPAEARILLARAINEMGGPHI